ncbi:hypothetical protein K458DRAFT_293639 [Lentithecium fluviatile CBS 122367]|uniref:SWIM-type domain-containing protein n=1 Tax=Lentithecium fluviatile CBS 122367 TaxID=1168545 RepID=A0A6G1JEY3_9PLEO|nr:hypothetical protein K458DRAFT_293639 [Lentithecium fluviatile CBS 122367]
MPSPDLPTSREFITELLNTLRRLPHASADATNAAATNPLVNTPEPVKKQLLALHVIFPNELLPALDLLDRRLVTRFRICREPDLQLKETAPTKMCAVDSSAPNTALTSAAGQMDSADAEMGDAPHVTEFIGVPPAIEERASGTEERGGTATHQNEAANVDTIYYVRSAQQRSSRYSASYDTIASYEVRPRAWNCSCPAFAFSAFPPIHPEPPVPTYIPTNTNPTSYTAGPGKVAQEGWSFGSMGLGEGTPPVCKHLLACVLAERCAALFGAFVEERNVSVEEAAGWAAGWGD